MPYQSPSVAELTTIIRELRIAYPNKNPLRLSCIKLLEDIASTIHTVPEDDQQDILLGALSFVLTDIASEYKNKNWLSPLPLLSPERSQLYLIISEKLKLSATNKLNDDERFMYFGKFYLHLMKPEVKFDLYGGYWPTKQALLKYVENALLALRKREADRIEALQATQPTLDALEAEIDRFCDAYTAEYNSRRFFKAGNRTSLINLIKFIRQRTAEDFPKEHILQNETEYLRFCYIRLGTIMYILLTINNEYGFFKPEGNRWLGKYNGSSLFKMCEKALNITSLTDLTCNQKMAWLNVLDTYLDPMLDSFDKNNPFYAELKEHKKKIYELSIDKDKVHNQPGLAMRCATTTTSSVASYAVGVVATQVVSSAVTEMAGMGALTSAAAVVGISSGPAGWLALGAGTIIMTQLLRTALPTAVTWTIGYLMNWAGTVTGHATSHIIHHTFSKNNFNFKFSEYEKLTPEQRVFIKKWIDTVLALPDNIIKPVEKQQIRFILGMPNNDAEYDVHSDLAPVFSASR